MKTAGLYKIINKVNGKKYVGSSNNVKKRWRDHKSLLRRGVHHNIHLQSAYNKYGAQNFEYELLKEVEEEQLLQEEQELLDKLFQQEPANIYNIGRIARSVMAGSNHTEEVKQILREKLSGEKHPHYGKPVSEEWRNNISRAKKRFSDEEEEYLYIQNISGKTKAELARELNVHPTTIRRAIKRYERFKEFYDRRKEDRNYKGDLRVML